MGELGGDEPVGILEHRPASMSVRKWSAGGLAAQARSRSRPG